MGVSRATLLLALIPAGAVRLHTPRAFSAPHQLLRSLRPVAMAEVDASATEEPKSKVKIKIKVKTPSKTGASAPAPPPVEVDANTKVTVSVKAKSNASSTAAIAAPAPAAPAGPVRTPEEEELLEAAQSANCSRMLDALRAGANPNIRDPKGRTPLHFMAGVGLAPGCVLLIHFGAQLEVTDEMGLTPLHMAAGYANAQTLKVLVAAGVDTERVTDQGTALDVVTRLGEYQYLQVYMNKTQGRFSMKKKDDKLEALKKCALALEDVETVKSELTWDEMLREVLKTIAV